MNANPPSTTPSDRPTRNSRNSTLPRSCGLTSPSASALVTVVAAWLPVLPPVPISSGMNNASVTTSASVSSNTSSTCTVSVAPTASTNSQTTRDRINPSTGAVR